MKAFGAQGRFSIDSGKVAMFDERPRRVGRGKEPPDGVTDFDVGIDDRLVRDAYPMPVIGLTLMRA